MASTPPTSTSPRSTATAILGLYDGLKRLLEELGPRAVSKIERPGLELLPRDTTYVSELLAREARSEWLGRAIEKVARPGCRFPGS